MLPRGKYIKIGKNLLVFEDIFEQKVFRIKRTPKFKFWGKWEIETPNGEILVFDRRLSLDDIVTELQRKGLVIPKRFYVLKIGDFIFATSEEKGSWVYIPAKGLYQIDSEYHISRVSLVSSAKKIFREVFGETIGETITKNLLLTLNRGNFLVYSQPQ